MHVPHTPFFPLTLLMILSTCSRTMADDHVVIERTRAGMGMQFPPRVSEIWLNETSVCTKGPRLVTIERYDLMKRWTLSPQTKRYFEEPLAPPAEEKKEPVTIQHAGWDYDPVYDWTVSELPRRDTVCGFVCRLLAVDGEADYSSGSYQLWVAANVPVNVARFNERAAAAISDFDWVGVARAHPPLKDLFILKSSGTQLHSIGPEMTYQATVTKLEIAPPPAGIYDIPDGYLKVGSMEELIP